MKRAILLLLVAFVQASPAAAPTVGGTVRGRIRVIDRGKPVAHDGVFVYLQPTRKRHRGSLPGAGVTAAIRQQSENFVPHVVVVPVGATVTFPNLDNQEHNVFSPTDPPGFWDLGRYSTDKKGKTHEFVDAGEIDIYCDIHKGMSAKIKVVDTPYIAAIGPTGEFTLDHVAPGSYTVVGWLADNDKPATSDPIVVEDGKTVQLPDELHLQLALVNPGPHKRKDGTEYPIYKP